MSKIDKSKYTKKEIQLILAERRKQKALEQVEKSINNSIVHPNYAFVLGNGTSRKDIPLKPLRQYGKVYACNAVYREFDPDYLIAVDVKMILEITKTGYQHHHQVWTNHNKSYNNIEGLNYFKPSKGWSSGPTALWLATQHAYEQIFILGFDYKGLEDGKLVNNIYAGTPNYKKTTDGATYYGNWLKQTSAVIKENPKTKFFRVIATDNFVPPELNKFSNLKHITVDEFRKMFGFS